MFNKIVILLKKKKKDDMIILSFSLPSRLDVQQKNPGKIFNGPSIQSPCLLIISTHSVQSSPSCNRPPDLPLEKPISRSGSNS